MNQRSLGRCCVPLGIGDNDDDSFVVSSSAVDCEYRHETLEV